MLGASVLVLLTGACGDDAVGTGGAGGEEAPPASTEPLASAVTEGTAIAVALATPLFADGDRLRQERDTATEGRAQELVENGVAGNSIVTSSGCVSFAWSGLSATITFAGCTMEATGLPLDGTMTLGATIDPTSFEMSFAPLTIGGTE